MTTNVKRLVIGTLVALVLASAGAALAPGHAEAMRCFKWDGAYVCTAP